MLRIYATYPQDRWDERLPALEFAYNNSKNATTGKTPFEIDTGRYLKTPISFTLNQSNVKAADDFMESWHGTLRQARDMLIAAQERQKEYADKKRREEEFEKGDKVLLSTRNITSQVDKLRPTPKLSPRFIRPYKIIKKLSLLVYKLELPHTLRIHPVFHVSLLKKYEEPLVTIIPPPTIVIDNEEEYEVEEILDRKEVRGHAHYLVKWKGYSLHDATWEPKENLANAPDILRTYESMKTSSLKKG